MSDIIRSKSRSAVTPVPATALCAKQSDCNSELGRKCPIKAWLVAAATVAVAMGSTACGQRGGVLAAHSRADFVGSQNAKMRMAGFCQKAHHLIVEQRQVGKLDPSDILKRLLEMENAWDWKNPYTGHVSKVVEARMPAAQGDMALFLIPPWVDGNHALQPAMLWVRCRIKGETGEDLLEQAFVIE